MADKRSLQNSMTERNEREKANSPSQSHRVPDKGFDPGVLVESVSTLDGATLAQVVSFRGDVSEPSSTLQAGQPG
jgi:hypothetical protein